MKRSILSAVVVAASLVAAPLTAGETVKPVEPKASTQGAAVALGALTQAQIVAIVIATTAAVTVVAEGGSTSDTTN